MVIGVDGHLDPFGPKLMDVNRGRITRPRRARWSSPELLENCKPTKESDVYAFGMVIYEVRLRATMIID